MAFVAAWLLLPALLTALSLGCGLLVERLSRQASRCAAGAGRAGGDRRARPRGDDPRPHGRARHACGRRGCGRGLRARSPPPASRGGGSLGCRGGAGGLRRVRGAGGAERVGDIPRLHDPRRHRGPFRADRQDRIARHRAWRTCRRPHTASRSRPTSPAATRSEPTPRSARCGRSPSSTWPGRSSRSSPSSPPLSRSRSSAC